MSEQDKDLPFSTLLADLDSLFDTRMGTITRMGDASLKATLDSGYYQRTSDSFKGVDPVLFKELYDKRDRVTLAHSLVTPVAMLMKDFAAHTLKNINNSPFHYRPKIMINVHPYKLTEAEQVVIIAGVRSATLSMADIEMVDYARGELTPAFVKRNLSVLILYHYDLWLDTHADAWRKISCPEVSFFGPRVSFATALTQPNVPEDDPFKAMEDLAEPFIGLKLLPSEIFSLTVKVKKKP